MINDKEIYNQRRKAWVHDLRTSGAKQGAGWLRLGDAFCCLGRACVISGIVRGRLNDARDGGYHIYDYDGATATLPQVVQDYYGIRSEVGLFDTPYRVPRTGLEFTQLASMNDGGCTFLEIADAIEARWDELFI